MKRRIIGFVGAGNMAEAVIKGLISAKVVAGRDILAADVRRRRLEELARELGIVPAASNADLCRKSDVIILSVKPQQITAVLKEIAGAVDESKLLISIAAGINLYQIESRLKQKARLIRVMPNSPLLVGRGMSAMACGSTVRAKDKEFVLSMFGSVGRVIEVEEKLMDAVTALSGSGPAYVFSFIEGLADGGVKAGLSRADALLLAAQTTAGAAQMLLDTGRHPGELRDMVASPAGTTIHGLHVLEGAGLRGILMATVEAAYLRSKRLSEEWGGGRS